jgi:acyl carrier protein
MQVDRETAALRSKRVIAEMVRRDPDTLTDRTLLFAGLGLNSANVLELLILIERELGIRLDVVEMEPHHLESVGSLTAYVAKQSGE